MVDLLAFKAAVRAASTKAAYRDPTPRFFLISSRASSVARALDSSSRDSVLLPNNRQLSVYCLFVRGSVTLIVKAIASRKYSVRNLSRVDNSARSYPRRLITKTHRTLESDIDPLVCNTHENKRRLKIEDLEGSIFVLRLLSLLSDGPWVVADESALECRSENAISHESLSARGIQSFRCH